MMTASARPLADPAIRRVAVVRLRVGLGDLLTSVPALRALRIFRPDLHVTMITWDEMQPAIDRQRRYVDDLLAFPGYPGIPERPPDRPAWADFVQEARSRRFDLAVQMYGGQAPANEVTAAVGAVRTAGYVTPGRFDADPATHLPYPTHLHEIHRHLRLVQFLGVPEAGDDRLEFPLGRSDHDEIARLGYGDTFRAQNYVCVHPGATAPSRRWLPERFAAVADALAARGHTVVLTGLASEAGVTTAVSAAMRAPHVDLTGVTSLGGFAALLADARLVVSNDTGTAHLAAAVDVPTVTVFQAGEPARWRGLDRRRHRVVQAGVACQPCHHQQCPIDLRCATHVTSAQVLAEADRALEEVAEA